MQIPEDCTYADLVSKAREEGLPHVADVLQNILDLDLADIEQCETYDLSEPFDGDDEVSEDLLQAIVEVIESKLDDIDRASDDGDGDGDGRFDQEDEDSDELEGDFDGDDAPAGQDEDDPYAVSVETLHDVRDFLEGVRTAL